MDVSVQLTGFKEVDSVLRMLPKEMNHRVLQNANADAAQVLVRHAQSLAPVRSGNLERSIGIVKPTLKNVSELGEVIAGPRRRGIYRGFHAHLIEYGKKNRGNKGSTTPKPFMKPAFDSQRNTMFNKINEYIGKRVVLVMRKYVKSGGGTWIR
jgi:hypothetical protein